VHRPWLFLVAVTWLPVCRAVCAHSAFCRVLQRLRQDRLRKGAGHCFGLFSPHRPVRFDMHNVSEIANQLFEKIDKDGNSVLSLSELDEAAKEARERAEEAKERALTSPRLEPHRNTLVPGWQLDQGSHFDHLHGQRVLQGAGPINGDGEWVAVNGVAVNGDAGPSVVNGGDHLGSASHSEYPGSASHIRSRQFGSENASAADVQHAWLAKKSDELAALPEEDDRAVPSSLTPAVARVKPHLAPIVIPENSHGSHHSVSSTKSSVGSAKYSESNRSNVFSPRCDEQDLRRRERDEEAAATAVLETIIRRMAVRAREKHRRNPPPPDDSSESETSHHGPGKEGSFHGNRVRRVLGLKTAARDLGVKKEEWDDAIAEALF
jgi:hypothetical protein